MIKYKTQETAKHVQEQTKQYYIITEKGIFKIAATYQQQQDGTWNYNRITKITAIKMWTR